MDLLFSALTRGIMSKPVIIIGAGPAGLTAALEILKNSDKKVIVLEQSFEIGGISRTINYKGNRIDIGGHRFFSKSEKVMEWWQNILPTQGKPSSDDLLLKRNIPLSTKPNAPDPEKDDQVFLVRNRLSRILFLRQFFSYPISLSAKTIKQLGFKRLKAIGTSYLQARLSPITPEKSLEDFFINRFGKELYLTFFKDYTEKVWGVPCDQIKPEWGAQRIKGLSITKTIRHAFKKIWKSKDSSIEQKGTETSLIEQFLYPKLGPGQLWETVAQQIRELGGEILLGRTVERFDLSGEKVRLVWTTTHDGKTIVLEPSDVISTMPLKDLFQAISGEIPNDVKDVAQNLEYRDFMTVGLLLNKLKIQNESGIPTVNNIVPDNWIYIQESDVKIGRLQIFNNWSPYMVANAQHVWMGLEYFCKEGDELWSKSDAEMIQFAKSELTQIEVIEENEVLDAVVIRVPKAYPAYFGAYEQFDVIKNYLNQIPNLYPVGRNGMHRYNNQDHSMLSAMEAVDIILGKSQDKSKLWDINAEQEYHEAKK